MQTEQIPVLKADEYPGGIWYYEPHTYQPYRYVLGRVGRHPLVCIGINQMIWTACRIAPCATKICAGSGQFWPRLNPPCGRHGAP